MHDRACRQHEEAKSALYLLDQAVQSDARRLEAALRANREPPVIEPRQDRAAIVTRVTMTDNALKTFTAELTEAQARSGESATAVKQAALSVIAGLLDA